MYTFDKYTHCNIRNSTVMVELYTYYILFNAIEIVEKIAYLEVSGMVL